MAGLFEGADVQSILDANGLLENDIIFPFTPILIPLTTERIKFNTSAMPAPLPAPPMIPVAPSHGGTGGSSSKSKWAFIGAGIGVGLLVMVSLSAVLAWCVKKRKVQQQHGLPLTKHSPTENNSWSVSSEGVRIAVGSLTIYKYEELQKATRVFSEENRVKGSVYRYCILLILCFNYKRKLILFFNYGT
ncbi:putative non-specific serine/threonine protein kinase [Helianthus anomalus]